MLGAIRLQNENENHFINTGFKCQDFYPTIAVLFECMFPIMSLLRSFRGFATILLLGTRVVSGLDFTFLQTHTGDRPDIISKEQFLAAPFVQLCPSGNCLKDCRNYTRIFQTVPYGMEATVQRYGQPDNSGKVNVTLFGLCTNLVSAARLAKAEENKRVNATSFFISENQGLAVSDPFKQVAISIAACLSDTCGRTRFPDNCGTSCSLRSLLNNNTDTFDWSHAMLACTQKLCKPLRALPFANQDVLGIGVSFCLHVLIVLYENC